MTRPPGAPQVWLADGAAETLPDGALDLFLSAEERQRAQRFKNPRHGRRYRFAHAVLRRLLAPRAGGVAPAELRFVLGPHGKPFLDPHGGTPAVRFNLSHAGDLVLVALAGETEVGVDIERLDRNVDVGGVAERFFHPAEVAALHRAPEQQRAECFFTFWTRKEALIKAAGTGLFASVQDIDGTAGTVTLPSARSGGERAAFQVRDLPAPPGFRAALAVPPGTGPAELLVWQPEAGGARWACPPAGPDRGNG